MRAINGVDTPGPIANIIINYINRTIEAVQGSGVPVTAQESMFEGGEAYTGPSKIDILNETITEAKAPKRKAADIGQTKLMGDDTDAESAGTPAEPGSDLDTSRTTEDRGSGDTTGAGDKSPDTGSPDVGATDRDGSRTRTDTHDPGGVEPGRESEPGDGTPGGTDTGGQRDVGGRTPTGTRTGETGGGDRTGAQEQPETDAGRSGGKAVTPETQQTKTPNQRARDRLRKEMQGETTPDDTTPALS